MFSASLTDKELQDLFQNKVGLGVGIYWLGAWIVCFGFSIICGWLLFDALLGFLVPITVFTVIICKTVWDEEGIWKILAVKQSLALSDVYQIGLTGWQVRELEHLKRSDTVLKEFFAIVVQQKPELVPELYFLSSGITAKASRSLLYHLWEKRPNASSSEPFASEEVLTHEAVSPGGSTTALAST